MRYWLMLLVAAVCAGAERDPDQTLGRLREIIADEAARIPNYTCVQTIDRQFFSQFFAPGVHITIPAICSASIALKSRPDFRLIPSHADRFRLDVRVGPDVEMYSWVGESHFEDRPLRELIGHGPTGTGAIGPALINVFGDAPEFKFEGDKTVDGRRAYAYSFRVPVGQSHQSFYLRDGSQMAIAYEGTILADAETGVPVQLTILAGELPDDTYCCGFSTELDYHQVRIGEADFPLPKEARQRYVMPSGQEAVNTITFSACREYQAVSTIAYKGAPPSGPAANADAAPPPPLDAPEGLPVTIALAGAIDSDVAAAGDPIAGRLAAPVLDKLKHVIAPEGTLVRGRISQVTHGFALPVARVQPGERVTIQLKIETIEIGGVRVPFRLTGKRDPAVNNSPAGALRSRGVPIGEFPQPAAGYAVVQCPGKRCVIRDGFRTEWVTVGQP